MTDRHWAASSNEGPASAGRRNAAMTRPSCLSLDSPEVRACLECLIPAAVGSAADDGTPNVTWLSIVYRLDATHVGLSRQFFRKTGANIRTNPRHTQTWPPRSRIPRLTFI